MKMIKQIKIVSMLSNDVIELLLLFSQWSLSHEN